MSQTPAISIVRTLRAEHEVLRALQDLLLQTSGADGLRPQLWYRLKTELRNHALAEEEVFYAHLSTFDGLKELAEHSVEEHRTIEELIDQLDHLGFDQPQWITTLERLVHLSNHHLDEEEVELFPTAGRVYTDAKHAEHVDAYREAKARLVRGDAPGQTTRTGADGRTYESRSLDALKALAADRGLPTDQPKSELISALRGAPSADA